MLHHQNVTRSATHNLQSHSSNFQEMKSDQFLLLKHHSSSKSRRQSVSKPVVPRPSLKPSDFDLYVNEETDHDGIDESEYDESDEDPGMQRQRSMIHLALPPEDHENELAKFLHVKPQSSCVKPIWYRPFPSSPRVLKIRGLKELKKQLGHIHRELCESDAYWQTQIKMLRLLQSLVIAGISKHEGMTAFVNRLIPALKQCLRHGQAHWRVNIEACVTIGFLATRLHREQFDHCALELLPAILALFGIVSTEGIGIAAKITALLVLQNLHIGDFILIITGLLASSSCSLKNMSTLVKVGCCELLSVIIQHWPVAIVEQHMSKITGGIYQGLHDASGNVRSAARRAFLFLKKYFIQDCLHLMNKLSPIRQKALTAAAQVAEPPRDRLNIFTIEEFLLSNEGHDLDKTYAAAYHGALDLTEEKIVKRGFADKATFIHSFGTDVLLDIPEWIEVHDIGMIDKSSDYLAMLPRLWHDASRGSSTAMHVVKTGFSNIPSEKEFTSTSPQKQSITSAQMGEIYAKLRASATKANHRNGNSLLPTVMESSSDSYTYASSSSHKGLPSEHAEREPLKIVYTPWRTHKSPSVKHGKPDNREKNILVYRKHKNVCTPEKNTAEYAHKKLKWIFALLQSPLNTDRLFGLKSLYHELYRNLFLTSAELDEGMKIILSMFIDHVEQEGRVLQDVLIELCRTHWSSMRPYLPHMLTMLIHRASTIQITSALHTAIQSTLTMVRKVFVKHDLMNILMTVIVSHQYTFNYKDKAVTLHFMLKLINHMTSLEHIRMEQMRLTTNIVFDWTKETYSPSVRKMAKEVLVCLYMLDETRLTKMIKLHTQNVQKEWHKILLDSHRIPPEEL